MLRAGCAAVGLPVLFGMTLAFGASTTHLARYGAIDLDPPRTILLWLIAAAEGALLWLAYGALRARGTRPRAIAVLACGGVVLAAIAFSYPVTTTADPLAYVGYAKLPHFADAYRPPPFDFGPQLRHISGFWGNPIVACVYGPLWLALDRAVLGHVHTIGEAVTVLRAQNLAALAVVVGALAAAGFELPVLALVALNPAALFSFVVSAHNDVLALAFIALAFACVHRRHPWIAAILAAAAGAVKIVFAVIALTAFFTPLRRSRRIVPALAALVLAAVASAAFGGLPYAHAMLGAGSHIYAATSRHALHLLDFAFHGACVAIALAAIAAGLWSGRTLPGATWSFWTLSATWFEWYLAWCLPYALRARSYAPVFLCAWPLAAMMLFHPLPHFNPMVLAVLLAGIDLVRLRKTAGAERLGATTA